MTLSKSFRERFLKIRNSERQTKSRQFWTLLKMFSPYFIWWGTYEWTLSLSLLMAGVGPWLSMIFGWCWMTFSVSFLNFEFFKNGFLRRTFSVKRISKKFSLKKRISKKTSSKDKWQKNWILNSLWLFFLEQKMSHSQFSPETAKPKRNTDLYKESALGFSPYSKETVS